MFWEIKIINHNFYLAKTNCQREVKHGQKDKTNKEGQLADEKNPDQQ